MHPEPSPPHPLSRRESQDRFRLFAFLNPLGANLTIGSTSALLALFYGASNFQMGLIYGAIHITGFMALFAPIVFAGRETTRVVSATWWARSFFSLLLLALPFLPGHLQSWGVVFVLYGFLMLRSLGNASLPILIRGIAGPREVGRLNTENFILWNLGCLFTSLLAWGVLSQKKTFGEQPAFMMLYGVAVVFNMASSWALGRLPPSGSPEPTAPGALARGWRLVRTHRAYREVVWLTLLSVPMTVAASYQVNMMKGPLGMGADTITALSVAGIAVALLGARGLLIIGTRIPVRPLMVGSHLVLFVLAAIWVWLGLWPPGSQPFVAGTLFITSALFLSVSAILLATLVGERLPGVGAISVSVLYTLAGVVGALSGIGLLQALSKLWPTTLPGMHAYSHAFALCALLSAGVCALALAMVRGRLSAFTGDLGQLRPDNLFTIFRSSQIHVGSSSRPAATRELENTLVARVPAQADLMIQALKSPELRHRAAAYRALFEVPRVETFPWVKADAENAQCPWRSDAVTVLGLMDKPECLAVLRQAAKDPDPFIKAVAWKGLLRKGEPATLTKLMGVYRAIPLTRHRTDMLWGFLDGKRTDCLYGALAVDLARQAEAPWQRAILIAAAESLGDLERLRSRFTLEAEHPEEAWAELISEMPARVAGAPRSAWELAFGKKGEVKLPKGAHLPGGIKPAGGTALLGLLHCAMLEEGSAPPSSGRLSFG